MSLTDLKRRLVRVEQRHPLGRGATMPPTLMRSLYVALAVRLGGYPLPYEPMSSRGRDTISDGFARALGYIDRDAMAEAAQSDPAAWTSSLEDAISRLFTDFGASDDTLSQDALSRAWAAILDIATASKVARDEDASARDALIAWLAEHGGFLRAEVGVGGASEPTPIRVVRAPAV